MVTPDPWLPFRKPRPSARFRLFCFPFAGGGASLYRTWPNDLPADVEVCAVQLPGREGRIAEAPIPTMPRLIPVLTDALLPYLDLPFALFGHSMGSLISFELCRELRRRGRPLPFQLIASGCRAPHLPDLDVIHDKPDEVIIESLRELGGLSEAAIKNPELMAMILPLMRGDGSLTETYQFTEEPPLDCSLTVFGGDRDPKTTEESLAAWRRHGTRGFAVQMFQGDHFYLQSARPQIVAAVARVLRASFPQAV